MDVFDFKNQMIDYMRSVLDRFNRTLQPIWEQYGLTMTHIRILMETDRHPGHTVGSLSSAVGIQRGNLPSLCKKLEREQLIERRRGPSDERVVTISITAAGKQVVYRIMQMMQDKYRDILAEEPKENFEVIFDGLQKLNQILGKMEEKSKVQ